MSNTLVTRLHALTDADRAAISAAHAGAATRIADWLEQRPRQDTGRAPTPQPARHRDTETGRVRARRPPLFRQSDLKRAVKVMERAGKQVISARITKDGIEVI